MLPSTHATLSPGTTYYTGTTEAPLFIFWPFSVITVFCFCIGVPANLLSLIYFVSKYRSQPTYVCLMYIFMNLADLVICAMCLPMAMSNLSGGRELFFSVQFLCSMWGYLWQILGRISIFSIGVMSIYRTICLSLPFIRLSTQHVLVPVLVYLVILLIQQTMPWWYGAGYYFYYMYGGCAWTFNGLFDKDSVEFKASVVCLILVEYIMPLFPIVISCIVSVVQLEDGALCRPKKAALSRNANGNKNVDFAQKTKRSATITIIILTVIYIVFNLPYCLVMLFEVVAMLNESQSINELIIPAEEYFIIFFFIIVYTVPLNSTINPFVYIFRIKKLRAYILNYLRCKRATPTQTQLFSNSINVGVKGTESNNCTRRITYTLSPICPRKISEVKGRISPRMTLLTDVR